jgi:hypothetical protein
MMEQLAKITFEGKQVRMLMMAGGSNTAGNAKRVTAAIRFAIKRGIAS